MISGSTGKGRIASAARADYAEAAVVILTTPGHQGKVYELAGDIAWTFADLATEISRISGKDVSYKYLSVGEYGQELKKSFGFPDGVAEFVAEMDVAASKDALLMTVVNSAKSLDDLPTPMPDTVAEV